MSRFCPSREKHNWHLDIKTTHVATCESTRRKRALPSTYIYMYVANKLVSKKRSERTRRNANEKRAQFPCDIINALCWRPSI